jgi:hypothetical protein
VRGFRLNWLRRCLGFDVAEIIKGFGTCGTMGTLGTLETFGDYEDI